MSIIVVADADPLHYLVLIDCGEILGRLSDHVLIPFAVRDELLHPRAPQKVKDWIISPRPRLELVPVTQPQPVHGLHRGETEALQLALERRADAVLMDDLDGRAAARRYVHYGRQHESHDTRRRIKNPEDRCRPGQHRSTASATAPRRCSERL